MQPLDYRIDNSLSQALACAHWRFPCTRGLSSMAAALAVGLRYGLLGIAADAYIVQGCAPNETKHILPQLRRFGTMIRECLQQDSAEHCEDYRDGAAFAATGQSVYEELFDRFSKLILIRCPLDLALSLLTEEFVAKHRNEIRRGRFWPLLRSSHRNFDLQAQKSLRYALCFFERRKFDLEEVPEIALLDE